MGNHSTRQKMSNYFKNKEDEEHGSKEDLAEFLATLSDMAATGATGSCLPDDVTPIPSSAANTAPPRDTNSTYRKVSRKLRHQSSLNDDTLTADDLMKQLQIVDSLASSDDTTDWASMRSWLVWCLHENLDETEAEEEKDIVPVLPRSRRRCASETLPLSKKPRHPFRKQISLDLHRIGERSGKMSGQSSIESSGDT